MSPRLIRHCVECPKCHTRYLIGASPYRNGSYLTSYRDGGSELLMLFCCCDKLPVFRRSSQLNAYEVSNPAHERGYGPPEEIVTVGSE